MSKPEEKAIVSVAMPTSTRADAQKAADAADMKLSGWICALVEERLYGGGKAADVAKVWAFAETLGLSRADVIKGK